MAVVPYFRWEQLQDDDAKRKFLWETLPAQALIINRALWGEFDCIIVMAGFVGFCERGMADAMYLTFVNMYRGQANANP